MNIVVVEPGAISEADKKKLEKSDYIVIESSEPEKIKILGTLDIIGSDEMLTLAMKAITKYETCYSTFGKELTLAIIRKSEKAVIPKE